MHICISYCMYKQQEPTYSSFLVIYASSSWQIMYDSFFAVIPSPDGKRSVMKLAQRMVNNFCSSINPPNAQQWTTFSETNEFEVRASLYKCLDLCQPSVAMVLSAATTIGLPVPPDNVFSFFKDERTRPQVWSITPIIFTNIF